MLAGFEFGHIVIIAVNSDETVAVKIDDFFVICREPV